MKRDSPGNFLWEHLFPVNTTSALHSVTGYPLRHQMVTVVPVKTFLGEPFCSPYSSAKCFCWWRFQPLSRRVG